MPAGNCFRHQAYDLSAPSAPYELLRPLPGPAVDSREFRGRMQLVGDAYRKAGVKKIVLVHGTFVGPDALGILTELARLHPQASETIAEISKRMVDKIARDAGNFTGRYAEAFAAALCRPGEQPIEVERFHWSSENNHIGRADGAIRLIELLTKEWPNEGRVLLWGHSHAGNVFALISNLLAGGPSLDEFFQATNVYYRLPRSGLLGRPHWQRVRDALSRGEATDLCDRLDFVTFGTPIRYGWDTGGCARLLHFVNHRALAGIPEYRARFPFTAEQFLSAAAGDYIQQLGVAGTNLVPGVLAWRSFIADHRLHEFLQPGLRRRDLLERLTAGRRVADDGTTLLVDYGPLGTDISKHMAGHAVYTTSDWLLFHAEQVAQRFYATAD